MNGRHAIIGLLIGALGLPLVQAVLFFVAGLLGAMQDAAGQAVLERIVLACLVFWLIDLVLLLIVLAVHILCPPPDDPPA